MADVIIHNDGSFEQTWKQVLAGWKRTASQPEPARKISSEVNGDGQFVMTRGRPRDSAMIAQLITRLSGGQKLTSTDDVMAADGGDWRGDLAHACGVDSPAHP